MARAQPEDDVQRVPIARIDRDEKQPRKHYDPEKLQELADSIKARGVLQPILLRTAGERFTIIAGERRWRASEMAGAKDIRAIVYPEAMSPEDVLEVQLIENGQRADLHPMEEAEGFGRLHNEFGLSIEKIAERTGKKPSTVYGVLKLLDLTEPVRKAFYRGDLTTATAELVARKKGENEQVRALEMLQRASKSGDPVGVREARGVLRRAFGQRAGGSARTAKEPDGEEPRRRAAVGRAVLGKVVEAIERRASLEPNDLRAMVIGLVAQGVPDALLERRGLANEAELSAALKKLSGAQLRGLVFELAVTAWAQPDAPEHTSELRALAKAYGVGLKEVADHVEAMEKAEALVGKHRA